MNVNAEELNGLIVSTVISCEKREDGYWEVVQRIKHRRLLTGKDDWEEKEVSMSAVDKDLEKASNIAMTSIIIFLETVGGDLFNEQDKSYEIGDSKTELLQ